MSLQATDTFNAEGFEKANELATAGNIFAKTFTDAVTAAGTTTTDATVVATQMIVIGTAAASTGIRLDPSLMIPGAEVVVRNNGANTVNIFPPTGLTIDAGSADAAVTLATVTTKRMLVVSATKLRTI